MVLTTRQLSFVNRYLNHGIGARAAIEAGYSARSARQIACRLLARDDIGQEIRARQAKTARELTVTRSAVIKALVLAYLEAKAARSPGDMIAACREIGRILGYYPTISSARCFR